tara:strand:+ start:25253 stop:26980 length:1728 start_codon:yes stop_codon:yes gene_type:complete
MAQTEYRGNVQQMAFPLLSTLGSRTVIDAGPDQTYVPSVSPDSSVPIDRGVPGAYYAHNVMPSTYGWQTVGYWQFTTDLINMGNSAIVQTPKKVLACTIDVVTTEPEEGEEPIEEEILAYAGRTTQVAIYDSGDGHGLLLLDENPGSVYFWDNIMNVKTLGIYDEDGVEIVPPYQVSSFELGIDATTKLTVAHVNGITYLYLSHIGCFVLTYDENDDWELVERDLVGLDKEVIEGIVASQGYLLAWQESSISWSSTVDVEDFSPSEITGSGGGAIQEAKGPIVIARETYLGFILYTTDNAVSVTYSGNEDYPWTFKAISSSGGVSVADEVSLEETGGYQHAYTTNGVQQVSHQRANTVMPHITDFISGKIFEDFDVTTNKFTQVKIPENSKMRRALTVIADRYFIVSYGLHSSNHYTHAIVVDIVQQRMGKLRIPHRSCFERVSVINQPQIEAKDSIGFIDLNGQIQVLNFDPDAASSDSVLLLGKYQLRRSSFIELQELVLENPTLGSNFSCRALPSLDGKNASSQVVPYELYKSTNIVKYLFDGAVGENVSVVLKGAFNLVTFVVTASLNGRY